MKKCFRKAMTGLLAGLMIFAGIKAPVHATVQPEIALQAETQA